MITAKTATLALFLVPLAAAQEAPPIVSIDSAPAASFPELGLTSTYRLSGLAPNRDQAQALAERLVERTLGADSGLAPVELIPTADGGKFVHVDTTQTGLVIEVDAATGGISFRRNVQGLDVEADTPNLLRGEDAIGAALAHLDGLGLLPADPSQLFVQHVGGLRMAATSEEGENAEFDKVTTVHLGRRIDGMPVTGPGSKIVVHLGADGELVGLVRRWIEVEAEAHEAADFLGTEEVVEAAERHLAREWNRAMTVRGQQPEPALFDDGAGRIEPAFVVLARLEYDPNVHEFARGEYVDRALEILPALRSSRARFRQQEPAAAAPSQAEESAEAFDPANDDEPSRR